MLTLDLRNKKTNQKKFYRVEVKVLPPSGEPRVRSVLRRFSHFERLHDRLKEELGPRASAGLELLPPKRSLAGPPREPRAVDRRRRELEAWLWRVVAHQGAARSRPLQAFLELGDAARTVGPKVGGGGGLENGGSSSAAAAASDASAAAPEDDGRPGPSASAAHPRSASPPTGPSSEAPSPPGGAPSAPPPAPSAAAHFAPPPPAAAGPPSGQRRAPPPPPPPRLALPVDHRAALRSTSRELRARLATASLDMRAAIEAVGIAEAAREALADRVAAL